ncbi:MAG: hypothetical protein Q9184_003601, partial [Pyrenodesmia sp. 2 TL-2023]
MGRSGTLLAHERTLLENLCDLTRTLKDQVTKADEARDQNAPLMRWAEVVRRLQEKADKWTVEVQNLMANLGAMYGIELLDVEE